VHHAPDCHLANLWSCQTEAVTEWELQVRLEQLWAQDGIRLGGETLLLAGREVMTDWAKNDSRKAWNKPSVDFVALDRQGRLVVIELKNRIDTRRQAFESVLQVTAMALTLGQSVSWESLERTHGRLLDGTLGGDLSSAWQATYANPVPAAGHSFAPVRRVLAATSLRAAALIAGELGSATAAELVTLSANTGSARLINRLEKRLGEQTPLMPLEFIAVDLTDPDRFGGMP
jgi:hypothetical protein